MRSDAEILKPLVGQLVELSARPGELAKKQLWADHQALKGTGKIPVCVYYEGIPEPTWQTILGPAYVKCADPLAQSLERDLRRRLWIATNVPDDHIVWPAVFVAAPAARGVEWGVPIERRFSGGPLGAYEFVAPFAAGIDLARVRFTDQEVDEAQTARDVERASELTAGRLHVYVRYPNLGYCPFDLLVEMRGLERVMMDAIERPEQLAALMDVITAGYQQHHENRQRRGHVNRHISPDGRWQIWPFRVHCCHPISSHPERTDCHPERTDCHPEHNDFRPERSHCNPERSEGSRRPDPGFFASLGMTNSPQLRDEWAYVSAQTSSGFGPGMFAELVHPYNVRLASYFTGPTVYYHGCETLDRKLDVLATLPNLRRLHVSPWSTVAAAVNKFRGGLVMEVHAHPGKVCFGGTADTMRAEIRELIAQAEGCPMDLNLSDIHSVDNRPETLTIWARVAQELAGR